MQTLLHRPLIQDLCATLGHDQVRLVGGCVRDGLAGIEIKDLDACTPLVPQIVMDRLSHTGLFSLYPTGLSHGTVTARHQGGESIEITTLREDHKTDGRHAHVCFTNSWVRDAARRDFTLNALMLDAKGRLYDFFGGHDDLKAGRIRFIGDPRQRLAEDWLRGLRYFRFWGQFGKYDPTHQERQALQEAGKHLKSLSGERIWAELKKLVQLPHARRVLALFIDLGFADALGLQMHDANIEGLDPVAAWAGLLGPENDDFLLNLRASKKEQAHFRAVRQALCASTTRFARQVRYGHHATQAAEALHGRTSDFSPPPEFPVTAGDLLKRGYAPGPNLGQDLAKLKERWIAAQGQISAGDLLADLKPGAL